MTNTYTAVSLEPQSSTTSYQSPQFNTTTQPHSPSPNYPQYGYPQHHPQNPTSNVICYVIY